jgi:glycosyltransferase involved in cell wall biosynthesis
MRVFHVITAVQPGGAEVVASSLAEYCGNTGTKVYVVAVRRPKHDVSIEFKQLFADKLSKSNVELVEFESPLFPFSPIVDSFRLTRKFSITKNDVVHLHTDIPEFFGVFLRAFTQAKFLRTIHNVQFWPTRPFVGKFVEYYLSAVFKVGVSKRALLEHSEYIVKCKITPKCRSKVIYNGVPADGYKKVSPENSVLRIDDKKTNFLFLGRLENQKGPDLLIEALMALDFETLSRITVHVIGDGPMRAELEKLVKEKELPVFFYGVVHGARTYIDHVDAVLMPSRFEGLPLVAMESLLQNKPVIATDAPGLSEIFEGSDVELSLADSPEHYSRSIKSFLYNKTSESYNSLYEISKDKFSIDKMCHSYINLYHELKNNGGS